MKRVLMISYLSKEIEGRLNRCFSSLDNCQGVDLTLLQGCINSDEFSTEKNVINISVNGRGIKGYLTFYRMVKKYLDKNKYDYVYMHNYFAAPFCTAFNDRQCIYDAYEVIYPGCGEKFGVRERIFYFFEKKAVKKSGLVISANEERSLIMTGRYKLMNIPLAIENMPSVIERDIVPSEKRDFAIVYAGYMTEQHGILELIKAVNEYNDKNNPKIYLDLFGKWMIGIDFEQIATDTIKYHGSYRWEELNSLLQKYKFGYLSYKNSNINTMLCAPNKFGDYVNNGNVIIANDNYIMSREIGKYNVGAYGSNLYRNICDAVNNYETYFTNTQKWRETVENRDTYAKLKEYILN